MHVSRFIKILLAFVVVVGGGYGVARWVFSSGSVSPEFREARLQGALVAQDIVNLSNNLSGELEKVNTLDREGKTKEALDATTALLTRSEEVRTKAVELSNRLSRMTGSLASIKSTEARAAALEAIADRLALINRLINYSDYLARLLNTLRERFAGVASSGNRDVSAIIAQINAEVTAINAFNRQASQAMDRFDAIMSR